MPSAGNGFPGFDTSVYPGDAAMQAWKAPASPYVWTGYYLPAPCHRDATWAGTRSRLTRMGWGIAAIYVGQQDWTQMSTAPSTSSSTPAQIICSATLLTASQGSNEATDAIARMRADGFPDHSVIFLDVEPVTTVSAALLEYVRAWVTAVAADGRYRPGLYTSKANAPAIYQAVASTAGGAPPFWVSSVANFATTAAPTDIGLPYAQIWQGVIHTPQEYNGVRLTIDVNVAGRASPGSP